MKYLCLLSVLAFGLWAGVLSAEDAKKPPVAETAVTEENADSKLKEIDVGGTETAVVDEDYGVNDDDPMAPGGIYDENTGLPNVVESDKTGELE